MPERRLTAAARSDLAGRIPMNNPANVLDVYKDLAECYERRGQAQMRDRFLVLAADAALTGGNAGEAERLRLRLLQVNPHHMLKPYSSFDQARTAPDVDTYIRNLRLNYPLEVAADLMRRPARQRRSRRAGASADCASAGPRRPDRADPQYRLDRRSVGADGLASERGEPRANLGTAFSRAAGPGTPGSVASESGGNRTHSGCSASTSAEAARRCGRDRQRAEPGNAAPARADEGRAGAGTPPLLLAPSRRLVLLRRRRRRRVPPCRASPPCRKRRPVPRRDRRRSPRCRMSRHRPTHPSDRDSQRHRPRTAVGWRGCWCSSSSFSGRGPSAIRSPGRSCQRSGYRES